MLEYEISVIVPCYNEELNLPELHERLQALFLRKNLRGECVFINDGSRDRTGPILDEFAKTTPNVRVVHHSPNRGIEGGWKSGIEISTGKYLCFIDADLQNQPEDIYRLYRELTVNSCDIVQGTRSHIGRLKDARYTLSIGLNILLNFMFGMKAKDNKSGFFIGHREVVKDIMQHRFHYRYYQSLIMVSAKTKGYTIREIETLFESRLFGESFINRFPIKLIFISLLELIKGIIEFKILHTPENYLELFLKRLKIKSNYRHYYSIRNLLFYLYAITLPLHQPRLSWKAIKYYHLLKITQSLDDDTRKEIQISKLRRLLYHVYKHVPYYRDLIQKHQINIDHFVFDDLGKLPQLTTELIKDNFYDLLSDNHEKNKVSRFGICSQQGEPFTLIIDRHQSEMEWAANLRSKESLGYQFGDKQIRIIQQIAELSRFEKLGLYFSSYLSRTKLILFTELNSELVAACQRGIQTFQPKLIECEAAVFDFIAQQEPQLLQGPATWHTLNNFITSTELEKSHPGVKIIQTMVLQDQLRYAHQSQTNKDFIINQESFIVELDNSGTEPTLFLTSLNNFCMPLIRYRISSSIIQNTPSSTTTFGSITSDSLKIAFSTQPYLLGHNGIKYTKEMINLYFKEAGLIVSKFDVQQFKNQNIQFTIYKSRRFNETLFDNKILPQLKRLFGEHTELMINYVEPSLTTSL